MRDIKDHYRQLLGLDADWTVLEVDLDLEAGRVRIILDWDRSRDGPCGECGQRSVFYDTRPEREWRHLDTMQYETVIVAEPPRCRCASCGVRTMRLPWAAAGSRFTLIFEAFAIELLLRMKNVKAASAQLRLSWDNLATLRKSAVERGLVRRNEEKDDILYAGVDEKSFLSGQNYVTVVTDPVGGRVLEVEPGRDTAAAAKALRNAIAEQKRAGVAGVIMDFWEPFARAAAEVFPQADIVHDKFHVSGYLNKAVDQVRRAEHRSLLRDGRDDLKGEKFLFLKDPGGWKQEEEQTFRRLEAAGLKTARAWHLKELFIWFWVQRDRALADGFFTRWWRRARLSKLAPVKAVAQTLKRHRPGLLNYIDHPLTNAVAEGMNSVIQSLKHTARGFRSAANYRIAILFHCGKLSMLPAGSHSKP
jgi:transposase